ncbi:L,D-transpeptidase [Bradyrhizobium sp. LHD-71]|uniref:L,D-transpeptidase n=1 Tax=Bradyrhizobium sp. LHD-71 TaxID=3072141 RepID=UPI00280DCAFD|nr:L,D-transpeptidase [Bradyrhizobium sp. LHD-71]MDQ8729690.1 L,D-transpeptidase [Bradyrhizobium sp. LHD-71]
MFGRCLLAACLAVAGAAVSHVPARAAPEMVAFSASYPSGTIVVNTRERRLYLVLGGGSAMRYRVGVGRAGKQWAGTSSVDGKYRYPAWAPPPDMARERRMSSAVVPGGSSRNPMGVAALTLAGGEYAIHGTNTPGSIGGFVSGGCIRMYNHDITDLYQRVDIGTPVVVVR